MIEPHELEWNYRNLKHTEKNKDWLMLWVTRARSWLEESGLVALVIAAFASAASSI